MSDSFWSNIFRSDSQEKGLSQLLAQVPIFSGLKSRELRALERIVHSRKYRPDETVFQKNDPGVGMYIIQSGSVRIILDAPRKSGFGGNGKNAAKKEDELLLVRLGPGDFFGEASLPDGGPRSATAIADEETSLIGFFRPDLLDLCERDRATGLKVLWNICEVLAVRLRHTNAELTRVRDAQRHLDAKAAPVEASPPESAPSQKVAL